MNSYERKLLRLSRRLDAGQREQLLTFAEFLHSRSKSPQAAPEPLQEPKKLLAAESETVVGAIKRLRESYSMLDTRLMLQDTAAIMSKHAVGGLSAPEAIAELEALFQDCYERYRSEFSQSP